MFLWKDNTLEAICETGIRMFVLLYCGKDSDSLADLRYLKYMKMALSSRTTKPESLRPTELCIFHRKYPRFER